MAYHVLARSLEAAAHAPPSNAQAFAAAVRHALDGIVPNERHRRAGRAARSMRVSESAMEWTLHDIVDLDFNPFVHCMLRAPTRRGALLAHRSFNQRAQLDVRMVLGLDERGGLSMLSRSAPAEGDDPAACRDIHLMSMELIMANIAEPSGRAEADGGLPKRSRRPRAPDSVSAVAAMLGLGSSVAGEAALAFESDAAVSVADLALHLGCRQRTLQRELKAAGLSAEALKRACMLSRATSLLGRPMTLTEIAHQSGYADHAHMTRAFVASCGLPPSLLRQALSASP